MVNLAIALTLAAVGYIGLIFPEVRCFLRMPAWPFGMASIQLTRATTAASAEMEAILSSFPATAGTEDNQDRYIQAMDMVSRFEYGIWRCRVSSAGPDTDHHPRLSTGGLGSPGEARLGIFVTSALHYGRRAPVKRDARPHGAVWTLLAAMAQASPQRFHATPKRNLQTNSKPGIERAHARTTPDT